MQKQDIQLLQKLVYASQALSPEIWDEFVQAWEEISLGRQQFLTQAAEVKRYLLWQLFSVTNVDYQRLKNKRSI